MDNNNMYNQGMQKEEQAPMQQNYQQQPYQNYQQQPYQNAYQPNNSDLEEPVSFGDWMVTMLLMSIPCVNFILLFVWAFGNGAKKSKSNYCKAMLVWMLIGVVLSVVIIAIFGASFAAIANSAMYY